MPRHNIKWLLALPPSPLQTIPEIHARLVWVPGYHCFPKWTIADRGVPRNDLKNNYGTQFGLSPILVSKVVDT